MNTLASFALYPFDGFTTTLLVCVALWTVLRAINKNRKPPTGGDEQ